MKILITIFCTFFLASPMAQATVELLQQKLDSKKKDKQFIQNQINSTLEGIETNKKNLETYKDKINSLSTSHRYYDQYVKNLEITESNIKILQRNIEVFKDELIGAERKIAEAQKNLEYGQAYFSEQDSYKCSPSTPTIDLEADADKSGIGKKGVFHGLGRDHQNGLGTCFANVAKNLLYAVSDGEANASFLDIALQYKDEDLVNLNGGTSCLALESMSENGFCPKGFSPIETGDKTGVDGFISSEADLRRQSYLLEKIESFLNSKSQLENEEDEISKSLVKNAPRLIQALSDNPHVELPYPSLGEEFFNEFKVGEHYHWGKPDSIDISEEDYDAHWSNVYDKFKQEFFTAIKKDDYKKTIPKLVEQIIDPFLDKYAFDDEKRAIVYNFDFKTFFDDFDRDEYLKKVKDTENFFAQFGEQKDFEIEKYLDPSCRPMGKSVLNFGQATKDLITFIKKGGFDPNKLLKDGKILSNKELIQLATTPKCAQKENRAPMPKFSCDFISPSSQSRDFQLSKEDYVRFRTLKLLRKGLPVGNSFATFGGHHINTIVGHRYNPEKDRCEYKIRESQNATSSWQSEKVIAEKVNHLTMADKE